MARKKKNARGATAAILAGVFVVTGLAAYIANGPGKNVPAPEARQDKPELSPTVKAPDTQHHADNQAKKETQDVTLYTPKYDGGELKFDKTPGTANAGSDAMIKVVNEYLAKIPAVPKEGRLKGVEIHGGIATLSFTPEFENGYGSEDEETIVVGILTALGQFPDIKKAQFTIEGKQLESLGHADLSTPQDVIR